MSRYRSDPWTPEELETLRRCYGDGGGGRPSAIGALPQRSPAAIQCRVWALGIAKRGRLPIAPPKPTPEPQPKPTVPKHAPTPVIAKPIVTGPAIVAKPKSNVDAHCDRGDREHIRRRIPHIVALLANELSKPPAAVARALVDLAKQNFEPDKIALLSTDREEILGASLGQSTMAPRPSLDRSAR